MDIVECRPALVLWNEALKNMQSALDALDDSGAPADIGTHLDLAICRLEQALGCNADNTIEQLRTEIESALSGTPAYVTDSDAFLWPSRAGTVR